MNLNVESFASHSITIDLENEVETRDGNLIVIHCQDKVYTKGGKIRTKLME